MSGSYHIGTGKGRKLGGGWRPAWLDLFGDPTASIIKFGMERFEPENSTLRRNRCEVGHVYSITVIGCPVCALARGEARVAVDIAGAVQKVRGSQVDFRFNGHCRHCGAVVPKKRPEEPGRQRRFCNAVCRHTYGNEHRG